MANVVGKIGWKVVTMAFAIPISRLVTKGTERVWLTLRPEDPPHNPAKTETSWSDAIAWAAVSGVGIAAGQLLASRSAAHAWRTLFGVEPPTADKPDKLEKKTAKAAAKAAAA
jgi:hypothetical protein